MFIRRFLSDPGLDVLLNIESVNILDLEPPAPIRGVGTGTVLCVGEFENGPFNAPTEVTSATDLQNTFGGLGFNYGGIPANYPCAVSRHADAAIAPEYWNGNGILQLSGKKYARLLLCRPDTSVGAVQFARLPYVTGQAAFRYALLTGQVLQLDTGSGPTSVTFTGVAATTTGVAGSFASFVGGETLVLGYDGNADFTVTFLAADTTIAAIIARINQYAGFAFATNNGGQIQLTGRVAGTAGRVHVAAGAAATTLGLTASTYNGTGDVGDISAVTFTEVKTLVEAGVANCHVEQDSAGRLRISTTGASGYIQVDAATTASALGFTSGQKGTSNGQAVLVSGTVTVPTLFAGGETITLGIDFQPNVVVTFTIADQTVADVVARINTAMGSTVAEAAGATHFALQGALASGQVRVVASSVLGVLTTLGLSLGTTLGSATSTGKLPAGTVVQNSTATRVFVTMQDVSFSSAGVVIGGVQQTTNGPWTVKVRHAVDDGTGLLANAGTLTTIASAPDLGSFSSINLSATTAALTETQVDVAYTAALAATLDLNSVAKNTNLIFSARQSNVIRKALKSNALTASASGMLGRVACIRPPLNTLPATAKSLVAEPGVGAYREQRDIYCYIGSNVFVPAIARRGLAGGAGFTADGNIDIGSDSLMASICSQLPPEENPGQSTEFTADINGPELGANVQGFVMDDYISFRAAGIAALRVDNGVVVFQSGVTNVDPIANAGLVRISRRRMADYIQDTLAIRGQSVGKKLSTQRRRDAVANDTRSFLLQLLNDERIAGFTVDKKSGNTEASLAAGHFRLVVNVKTFASLDDLTFATTVGESVQVNEVLTQTA